MATIRVQPTIMPPYRRRVDDPSRVRRLTILAIKLLLAAGYGALVVMLPPTSMFLLGVPIAVMLVLVLWLMPDRGVFPYRSIERLFLPLIFMTVLWPAYIAVDLPGLPWVTPSRMLLFAILFLLVYSVATSSALRGHLMTVARSSRPVWIALLLWEFMQIITIPLSANPGLSANKLVNNQINLVGFFFLGCLLFTRAGWATKAVGSLVVIAVLASIDGMIELRLGYPPWANSIPSFMRIDDATLANVLGSQARFGDGLYRVRGPFSTSLSYAEYLSLCMPFVFHWLVTGRSVILRVAMGVAGLMITFAILISQSRLGIVGEFVALLGYVLLWGIRKWSQDKTSVIGPMFVLGFPAAAALLVLVILSSNTLSTRFLGGGAQAASNASRAEQRRMAVPKVLTNPIGHGLGTSGNVLGFVSPNGMVTVDSYAITTVLDLGIVGLFSFFGLFIASTIQASRMFFSVEDREIELIGPVGISLAVFAIIKLVLSQENNHNIAFLLLGMAVALRARQLALVSSSWPLEKAA